MLTTWTLGLFAACAADAADALAIAIAAFVIGASESLLDDSASLAAVTCCCVSVGVSFADVTLRTVSKIPASRTPYAITHSILQSFSRTQNVTQQLLKASVELKLSRSNC